MLDYRRFFPSIHLFIKSDKQNDMKIINMWFHRPITSRNYSGEQKVNFESSVPFSKCLRVKIYGNINVYFDLQGCRTLLLKESEPLLFSLGSWTSMDFPCRA